MAHLRPMNATEQPLIMVVVTLRLLLLLLLLSLMHLMVLLLLLLWTCYVTTTLTIIVITTIDLLHLSSLLTRAQYIMTGMGLSVEPQPKHFVSRQIRT